MVQTLQLNSNGDLFLNSSNSLTMLSGIDAVAAACNTACLTQLGECVLETGIGLPNFQALWVGVPDYAIWQSYLENTLLNVPGVASVQSITLSQREGVLSYVAEINSIYGPTTAQGAAKWLNDHHRMNTSTRQVSLCPIHRDCSPMSRMNIWPFSAPISPPRRTLLKECSSPRRPSRAPPW